MKTSKSIEISKKLLEDSCRNMQEYWAKRPKAFSKLITNK